MIMLTVHTGGGPGPDPNVPTDRPPPPIKEPDPDDRLPDERPEPNPDENRRPPKSVAGAIG
ncbi:hypothetical protein [Hoeflea sp. BAL378]|uniref:hypothetical protein n=1 Tax=Hoeflea sp. BAL378 TaxID=1547437 RepID=UPI00054F5DF3|nr:hypothetical protein [Hoeflea sp. BAL378]